MTQKNILITGASGCVGQYTASWLFKNSNAELLLWVRDPNKLTVIPKDHKRIKLLIGDIRSPELFAKELSQFKNLHVRVSIKGCSYDEYSMLTNARPESYDIPYKAIENLINNKVSCNACLSISFSDPKEIKMAEKRLYDIKPGILKSLEKEYITMFPKVQKRLNRYNLRPNKVRQFGKIIDY